MGAPKTQAQRIADANDLLRGTFMTGRVALTQGVSNLPDETRERVLTAVRQFSEFTPDNDPHGEHDFGAFEIDGEKFFWKIDYYDRNFEYGADPYQEPVKRLLTIMLAEEY
jgi:hypothetical protein